MTTKAAFEVHDPHYVERVRESFARQGLMRHLGAGLGLVKPGEVEMTQQHSYFHAGVSSAIGDTACGYAAYTLMPADSSVLTVEFKVNLLAPADGEELIARARVVRSGKTLKICSADVFVRKDGAEQHCATMLSTVMCMTGKSDKPRS
jgi:uncharacterized protein (TIGR00369 family)